MMAEFKMAAWIIMVVKWEWMSLSQIELVWVRVLCKMAESKMAHFKMADIIKLSENEWVWVRIELVLSQSQSGVRVFLSESERNYKVSELKMAVSESTMAEFKMAAIIKLSQNEWVKFLLCKMAESKMVEFKMAAIIKLSQNEWVKFLLCKMAESKMVEFKMAAIIKLSQNKWKWSFFLFK